MAAKFYSPHKIRFHLIHPFSRRYLTHIIIIIVAFFTVAANLNAYETRHDDFGQNNIIASLVSSEDLGSIQQEGPIADSKIISHYLGANIIASQPQIPGIEQGVNIEPTTIAGGSAIVRPILSPAEEQLRQRDKTISYTVQPGDTISEIAANFGISTYTIIWENNLGSYGLIQPGDKLSILPVSGIRHKILKGESLTGIAKKYGVDAAKIIEFNKLAAADDITVGETLIIPGGEKLSVPTPTYAVRSFYQPTRSQTTSPVVSTGRLMWPNGCQRITQYFSWLHTGVDIACPYGTSIRAADSGRVIKAQGGWNGGYGNETIIDHGNGIQTLYGHQSAIYVEVGEYVTKGQVIGAEGSTGRSTGPHLHFEVRTAGVRRNPLSYIR